MHKLTIVTSQQKLVERLAGSLRVPGTYRGKDVETMITEGKRAYFDVRSIRTKEFATFDVKLKKKYDAS